MKRVCIFLLCSFIFFTACGTDSKENNNDSQNTQMKDSEHEKDENEQLIISMELLMNADETPANEFDYTVTEEGICINEYLGESAVVVIPEKIDGTDVVKVGLSAFMNNEYIIAVKVADTVIDMSGYGIFMNCVNLKYIIWGNNVEVIGESCISGCMNLEEIQLNNQLKKIDTFGLYTGSEKLKEIHVPESVIEMGEAALNDFSVIYVRSGSYAEEYMKSYETVHDYVVE